MQLSPILQTFVLHFGEMGSRWGINRTVGQIYALLYLADEPLNAEQICESLGFSRSNVSMGLKELEAWRLIRLQHLPNDRRDYFTTPEDIWEIVRTLIEERRKREIEPTLTMLRDVLMDTPASKAEKHAQAKMQQMHDAIDMMMGCYSDLKKMETKNLVRLLKMGTKMSKLYAVTGSKTTKGKKHG